MNSKIRILFNQKIVFIWINIAVLMLSSMLAYAAYIGEYTSMKRVVVSTTIKGQMFSSDLLYENGVANKIRRTKYFNVLTDEQIVAGTTYNVDVHIMNYNVKNPKKHYERDIEYSLQVALVTPDGEEITDGSRLGSKTVTIAYKDSTGAAQSLVLSASTLNGTIESLVLTADSKETVTTEQLYQLQFSNNWDLGTDNDICVRLETILNDGYDDLTDLGGIIQIAQSNAATSGGWNGEVREKGYGGAASDYDAYNFVLTGTGKATITFEWDTTKLEVNKSFYQDEMKKITFGTGEVTYTAPTNAGDYGNWAKLVIEADSGDEEVNAFRNRYDFQLYKVSGSEPSGTGTGSFDFVNIVSGTTSEAAKDGYWATCMIRPK